MRLRGGDDWQRKLEKAIRDLSLKVLFVGTPAAAEKQGVRNEIQVAHDVGKEIGDTEFIIPLRVRDFRAPFLIVHAQYIDFEPGWARGLSDLTKTLESYGVARAAGDSGAVWRSIQLVNAKSVVGRPERLASNWLEISRMPPEIRLVRLHGVRSPRSLSSTREGPWPAVPHRDGFLSFADPDAVRTHFGETLRGESIARRRVDQFLDDGWPSEGIERRDAENAFADLARQGIERFCISRGLSAYALSAGRNAWWANLDVAPTSKIVFRWRGVAGKRLMQGKSNKRGFHWHIGASFVPSSHPFWHVKVIERLIFTEDGKTPFADPRRMQRLRKSFAKTWRNPRWRDMMHAYLWWLSNGGSELTLDMGTDRGVVLRLPPLSFTSPVSIPREADAAEVGSDDDLDADWDDEDYEIVEEADE